MERLAHPFAQKIDHTLLKPNFTRFDLERLCAEAKEYQFFSVCVPPAAVRICKTILSGTPIKVITVVGFPLGYSTSETKAFETRNAIEQGADEIDVVAPIHFVMNQDWSAYRSELAGVKAACGKTPLKVILETAYLTPDQVLECAKICEEIGANFVKTSTGFAPEGARVSDIESMRKILKPETQLKASGGIRDHQTAKNFIDAGADRLGTSSSIAIVTGGTSHAQY